jgi:Mg-chelatase subunit ChlD
MMHRFIAALLAVALLVAGVRASAADAPRLRVVLVLDASGSMKKNDPDLLARLAAKLLVDLADARDHVTVVSFGSGARTLHAGSGADRERLFSAIERVGRDEECTDYARGLEAAASVLPGVPAPGERRLVVFLTDGQLEPALEAGKKGCGRFEGAADADRKAARERVVAAAQRLAQARAKVYSVGLGDKLAASRHSAALLEELSLRTGGRFLVARQGDQLPEFFAGIFAALVGAPVSKHEGGGASLPLVVPEDSGQVHVVVRTDEPGAVIELRRAGESWPFGKPDGAHRGPELRIERGRAPRGYVVAWLRDPAPGAYELTRRGSTGALRAWVIADVGLSLRIEAPGAVVPETEAAMLRVALRSRGGKPVPLDPAFLHKLSFELELPGKPPARFPSGGRDSVQARIERLAPRAEPYLLRASAQHAEGFLQVDAIEHRFRVIHQVPFEIDESVTIEFDTMAEPGPVPLIEPALVRVKAPAELPTDFRLRLELAEGPIRSDLRFEPAELTFGPGRPRELSLRVSFADPEAARSLDRRYEGSLRLVLDPEHQKLASGKREWSLGVRGNVRSWTLERWLREYRWQIGIGLLLLLLAIWGIGRAVARDFPSKARIHYLELGQAFESDSLIRRFASKGAYRSARIWFPLGKKAKKLVSFVSTGAGFEVRPERGSPVTLVGEPEGSEKRAPFRGAWEQRYRLSDRHEVWLTRS